MLKQFTQSRAGRLMSASALLLTLAACRQDMHDQPKYRGYEVVLDVYPNVFAYGILLLPKDIKAGDKDEAKKP